MSIVETKQRNTELKHLIGKALTHRTEELVDALFIFTFSLGNDPTLIDLMNNTVLITPELKNVLDT